MATVFGRFSTCCCDIFEFFHPPLLDRRSLVVIGTRSDRFLADLGPVRGGRNPLPHATCPFICLHRIFHMDCRKYRHVLWCLGISKSNRCLEPRSSGEGELMALTGDCQLSDRGDVEAGEGERFGSSWIGSTYHRTLRIKSGEIGLKKSSFVICLHIIIFFLWIMNSGYLFSMVGMILWIASVALGFIIQRQLDKATIIRRVLVISNWWMLFLMVMTVGIYFAVSSMP